jgi:hypothetical protein
MTLFEILSLIMSGGGLLSSLFGGGGGDEQSQTTTSETTNPTYRSPALGMMEPGILSALLGNAQALGGAGMPGGVSRFGSGADSMFGDIIGLLSKDWGNIMKEYNPGGGVDEAKALNCKQECTRSGGVDSLGYKACYNGCMNRGQPGR